MQLLPVLMLVVISNVLTTKTTLANPLADDNYTSDASPPNEWTSSFTATTFEVTASTPAIDVTAIKQTETRAPPAADEATFETSLGRAAEQERTSLAAGAQEEDPTTLNDWSTRISGVGSDNVTADETDAVDGTAPSLPTADYISDGSTAWLPLSQTASSEQLPSSTSAGDTQDVTSAAGSERPVGTTDATNTTKLITAATVRPAELSEVVLMASLIPVGGVFVVVLFVAVICTATRKRSRRR